MARWSAPAPSTETSDALISKRGNHLWAMNLATPAYPFEAECRKVVSNGLTNYSAPGTPGICVKQSGTSAIGTNASAAGTHSSSAATDHRIMMCCFLFCRATRLSVAPGWNPRASDSWHLCLCGPSCAPAGFVERQLVDGTKGVRTSRGGTGKSCASSAENREGIEKSANMLVSLTLKPSSQNCFSDGM